MAAVLGRSTFGLLEEWCREQSQSDGRLKISGIPNSQKRNVYAGKTLRLNFMPLYNVTFTFLPGALVTQQPGQSRGDRPSNHVRVLKAQRFECHLEGIADHGNVQATFDLDYCQFWDRH